MDTDVDECAMNISECQQICKNSIGSYSCGCYEGYHLGRSGFDCLSKYIKC